MLEEFHCVAGQYLKKGGQVSKTERAGERGREKMGEAEREREREKDREREGEGTHWWWR